MAKKKKQSPVSLVKIVLAFAIIVGIFIFPFLKSKLSPPCANAISCIKNLSGEYQPETHGTFLGKTVDIPRIALKEATQTVSAVLGTASGDSKHIYVDLSTQTLSAYDGNKLALQFPVSTGKWGRTPTGDFRIWVKLRYTRMTGGQGADYYDLPNVPYTMFFYSKDIPKTRGYALHGAYWHNNFGHTMSHGCVNIRPEDAVKLYNWADPPTESKITYAKPDNEGTLITISGTPPTD